MSDSRSTQIAGLLEDASALQLALDGDVPDEDGQNKHHLRWLQIRLTQALETARQLEANL